MISKKTKTAIKNATTVSPKEDQVSPPSDIKIVYGPLLKYGVVAIAIVAVIITAAVLTERKVENFNNELAMAKPKSVIPANIEVLNEATETPELISGNSIDEQLNSETETQTEITDTHIATIEETAVTEVATSETKTGQIEVRADDEKVNAIIETDTNQVEISTEETAIEEVLATGTTVEDNQPEDQAITINASNATSDKVTANTVVATQYRDNIFIRDQQQLEKIRRNHERNIASLRNFSGHQKKYLEQNIKQMEQNYQKHITAIKRSQEFRNSMYNQI